MVGQGPAGLWLLVGDGMWRRVPVPDLPWGYGTRYLCLSLCPDSTAFFDCG